MLQQIGRHTWYDLIPTQYDHAMQQDYEAWLLPFPWQAYFTFTSAYPVARETIKAQFLQVQNKLERTYRQPIGYVYAPEDRSWSGCGRAATRVHLHGLLCCDASLSPTVVKDTWKGLGHIAGNAKVDLYDPAGNAVFYALKSVYESGDWDCGHLEFFQECKGSSTGDHQARRRAARRQQRLQQPYSNSNSLAMVQ
jgi:hypothetical protein